MQGFARLAVFASLVASIQISQAGKTSLFDVTGWEEGFNDTLPAAALKSNGEHSHNSTG